MKKIFVLALTFILSVAVYSQGQGKKNGVKFQKTLLDYDIYQDSLMEIDAYLDLDSIFSEVDSINYTILDLSDSSLVKSERFEFKNGFELKLIPGRSTALIRMGNFNLGNTKITIEIYTTSGVIVKEEEISIF